MGFSDDIRKARKQMIDDADEYRQAVTISLFNSVILDTPVDTGRLRGNWQTSEGEAKTGEVNRLDKSGGEATTEAQQVVQSSNPDTVVHLTNNLPYATKMEFGGSDQSPQGMVRKNVARIEQILRNQQK